MNNSPATLHIIQHNVRFWSTNKIALSNIYNHLNPDIILINSHSLLTNEPLKIFNYNIFSSNKLNERHAGTAIAIRKNLPFKLIDNFNSDMIGVTIETNTGPITIVTTYVPPRTNYLNFIDFYKTLSLNHPSYIIADLNARHPSLGNAYTNNRGTHLNHFISNRQCFHIGPYFPTYLTHNYASSPDLVLKNKHAHHNINIQPGPITPSDHIPILVTISTNPIQIPIATRPHYHKANWSQYKNELSNITLPTVHHLTLNEIDNHLDTWTKAIVNASNRNIPTISYRIIPGIKPDQTTIELQHHYNALKQDIIQHGPSLQKYRTLIRLQHELNTHYKNIHTDTWNNIINKMQIEPNPKIFWRSIRKLSGNSHRQYIPYIIHNNTKIHDTPQKEIIFRNHWTSIFDGKDPDINDFDHRHIRHIEQTLQNNAHNTTPHNSSDLNRLDPIQFNPITLQDIKTAITRMKQKAPGPSGITAIQLKHLPNNMLQYLCYIFNHSLSAGYFPDSLKIATLIFIPKGSKSQQDIKNYRPISLLEIHGKILDRTLQRRLYNHLEEHNLINPKQHGFRQFRGTATALAILHEKIAIHSALKQKIDIVLRDVSKAFDKVWHTGLKHKLTQLNTHPLFIRILCNFLNNRKAQIRIHKHTGPHFNLHSGVPQGAVLSPTLYSYYTNDIPPPLLDTDYILYADDITQIITTPHAIVNNTEHAIKQINEYENKWKIQTNIDKFTIINIIRHKTNNIHINNRHIPYSKTGKILGLQLSKHGYTNHITARCSMARAQLIRIKRFQQLNTNTKRKLYLALVRSVLIYPTIPLHTLSHTAMSRLQSVQNKALNYITNLTWQDFQTSEYKHHLADLPTINTVLHNQATKIWNTLELIAPDIVESLTFPPNTSQNYLFRSSRIRTQEPPPQPSYRI